MLISETRIRSLVRKALLEAASQEEIDKRAVELKKDIPGLSDAQARLLAREELKGDEDEGGGDSAPAEPKGFGEWDKAGGDAFRKWMNDNYEEAAQEFDLDPPGKNTSHTNKFIKNAYRGTFTEEDGSETTYGEAWLATQKAEQESARQEASGGGDISTEEKFFKQRALNYQSFLKEEGDSEANRAEVQDESITSFFYGGMPLRYVYHYNEFGRGGARPKKFKAVNPSVVEDLETVGIDVAAVRALNGRAGRFKYKKNDNAFSIAYSPKTKTLYFSADSPDGGEAGTRNFKIMNVPYVNGVLKLDDATTSEEGDATATAETRDAARAKWDEAQKEANRLYANLFRKIKRQGKYAQDEMEETFTDEASVMKWLSQTEDNIEDYHAELIKQYNKRMEAEAALPDEDKPDTNSDTTPWGSDFKGMWSGWYPFADVCAKRGATKSDAGLKKYFYKGGLDAGFGNARKMEGYIDTFHSEWTNMKNNREKYGTAD